MSVVVCWGKNNEQAWPLHEVYIRLLGSAPNFNVWEYGAFIHQQYVTVNFQMFKLVLEKAEESEIKLPTSVGSSKKQESSGKTSISALLTMPKPLTVWITINWKILKEMGIPDHLICLFRNLCASQEVTVRTGHGTTDWSQIGKGVRQGSILSPCLFNLYAGDPTSPFWRRSTLGFLWKEWC